MIAVVTGCAGFIGSHLCESLLAEGHEVVGVDALTDTYSRSQKHLNLQVSREYDSFSLIPANLADADPPKLCGVVSGADVIFHLAGEPGVRASWGAGFGSYVRNNIVGTQRLLEAIHRTDRAAKMVLASSSSVYGDVELYPTPETSLPRPVSPYGVTKLGAEHLCRAYHLNFDLPLVVLRYFTVYGPRQRPDMAFHRFIVKATTGEPISIYDDGTQSRDFTYVSDIVAATRCAATADAAVGGLFNIGSGRRTTIAEVLDVLTALVGAPLDVVHTAAQPGDARDTSADVTRARECLAFEPRIALDEGLRAEFDWLTALRQ